MTGTGQECQVASNADSSHSIGRVLDARSSGRPARSTVPSAILDALNLRLQGCRPEPCSATRRRPRWPHLGLSAHSGGSSWPKSQGLAQQSARFTRSVRISLPRSLAASLPTMATRPAARQPAQEHGGQQPPRRTRGGSHRGAPRMARQSARVARIGTAASPSRSSCQDDAAPPKAMPPPPRESWRGRRTKSCCRHDGSTRSFRRTATEPARCTPARCWFSPGHQRRICVPRSSFNVGGRSRNVRIADGANPVAGGDRQQPLRCRPQVRQVDQPQGAVGSR